MMALVKGINYMIGGIYFFSLGLIIGSFLNVVIYRLPANKSIINPPSHCPHCKQRLKAIDLIPVLSYLLNKGKCRYCREKISIQYPLVELLTGLLFFAAYLKFGFSSYLFIILLLLSALIVVSIIDLKYMIIPNQITYGGLILSLFFAFIFDYITLFNAFLGIIIPSLVLFLIIFFSKGGMGVGDLKLAAMLGGFLGYKYVLAGIFLGSLIGSIIGIYFILSKKWNGKTMIPFGPLIALGNIIMIFFGRELFDLYIAIFV